MDPGQHHHSGPGENAMRDIPRIIVARPRAVPIPRPLMALGPTRLNLFKGYGGFESVQVKAKAEKELHVHRSIL